VTKDGVKALKEQNRWLIVSLFFWTCAYVVILVVLGGGCPRLQSAFARLSANDGVFVAFAPLLAVVLTGLVSSDNKTKLIFWRWRNSLSGRLGWAHRQAEVPTPAIIHVGHRVFLDAL
jgi:hypothetical protein